ncbi:MAG TPA: TIGR04500 family putative peptide maturation system protein [Blastocatellia bacterium]|nr:TIGR04500 family putative peptide maturation system protein [Blastocatellia bacterium]
MIELEENAAVGPQMLGDALRLLTGLVKGGKRPDEALREFNLFRERCRPVPVDLVWEEERYSAATNYDILFQPTGQGTVSLSFCPDRAVPWLLRHAHNPAANVVVRVNDSILEVELVMAYLDFIWDEAPVITDLVNKCLIREAIQQRAIDVSDEELQQAMDAFRERHGLHSAENTHAWIERRGTTHERLDDLLWGEVATARLKDQIAGGHVEEYFEHHRAGFETAQIARFRAASERAARSVCDRIRRGETDFFEAARDWFFSHPGESDGKIFAVVRRGDLAPDQAAAIFTAAPGELAEPVRSGDGYDIVRVLRVDAARLDGPTRQTIKEILFKRWLDERRAEATIEWFWGRRAVASG